MSPNPSSKHLQPAVRGGGAMTPARLMVLTYLALVVAGTLALRLPGCSAGEPIGWIDALFMTTSAVCVTGLGVVDAATGMTRQGQWILMVLIQLGGLGILTFTTWIMMLGRRPVGVLERMTSQSSYGSLRGLPWTMVLKAVFYFTLMLEAVGALIFYPRMHFIYPSANEALFQSVFHSVSAFCNAGFSTHPGGLAPFRDDLLINLNVSLLVISGGLGFLVLSDLAFWLRRRRQARRRLSLHSRVAIRMTVLLLLAGLFSILLLEWNGALAGLRLDRKVMAAFFLSMTSRTAGFNTLPTAGLQATTLTIVMLLMVVGASPGSTGGGIKTTTMAILMALVRSQSRGKEAVELRGRTVPRTDVARALATVAMYFLTLLGGLILLLIVQNWGQPPQGGQAGFLSLVFEAISALSTVGLSMDTTVLLTPAARLVIVVLMLCGRLGPISLLLTLVGRQRGGRYDYPEESVMTG